MTSSAILAGAPHFLMLPNQHQRVPPRPRRSRTRTAASPLFDKPLSVALLVSTLLGAVSPTSWLCAAHLGVARELNGVVKLAPLLQLHLALLALAWLGTLGISSLARFRRMRLNKPAVACAMGLQIIAVGTVASVPSG